ncbi:MAG TPA: GxxExxY protein [Bacteroidia bacterium]|nr:GxxExxY protein [Bacteroidia bacterium]HNP97633.1 GxxExxY protein [Bacteroidia bacterium]
MDENELSKVLIGIFIKVHKILGPGLLESVYEEAIAYELTKMGIPFLRQQGIIVKYDEVTLDQGFRADFIVMNKVIIELKSVDTIAPVHHKQLLTYLKMTKIKLGLLVNFNVNLVKEGIVRLVNKL